MPMNGTSVTIDLATPAVWGTAPRIPTAEIPSAGENTRVHDRSA